MSNKLLDQNLWKFCLFRCSSKRAEVSMAKQWKKKSRLKLTISKRSDARKSGNQNLRSAGLEPAPCSAYFCLPSHDDTPCDHLWYYRLCKARKAECAGSIPPGAKIVITQNILNNRCLDCFAVQLIIGTTLQALENTFDCKHSSRKYNSSETPVKNTLPNFALNDEHMSAELKW